MKASSPADHETSQTSWFRRLMGQPVSAPPAPVAEVKPVKKKVAGAKKVLIVDDDPLFLKLTASLLETDGYDVVTAKDGCEAIEAVRKEKPGLVVLDVNLPQDFAGVPWDGFRVIEWLQRFESLKSIPVIMTTSGDASKYTRKAIGAGATAFFHKRMSLAHLSTMVKHSLMRKNPALAAAGHDTNFSI